MITVPANFNSFQKEATREAAEVAGFRVLRLITEPTAAALASKIHENREDDDEKVVLVFDFGGGTFDVTIGLIEDYNLVV